MIVENNQWYSRSSNPDSSQYAQINYNGDTGKYSLFYKIFVPITYNGKKYVPDANYKSSASQYGSKFYTAVTKETVTYSGTLDTTVVKDITDGTRGTVYTTSGQTIIQNVTFKDKDGNTQEMFVSGSSYPFTETYYSTEGKTKTRPRTMAIGDVQFVNVGSYSVQNSDGTYTESPEDAATFKDDDGYRYDYVKIFNLDENSTYDSFYNVKLLNYTYLAKNETGANNSHDMFFTTYRSKHID